MRRQRQNREAHPVPADSPQSIERSAIVVGSGNVFADLGLPSPEERQRKATIANGIEDIMDTDNLSVQQAASIMNVTEADVDNIVEGRLMGFSAERLFQCFAALLFYNYSTLEESLDISFKRPVTDEVRARMFLQAQATI